MFYFNGLSHSHRHWVAGRFFYGNVLSVAQCHADRPKVYEGRMPPRQFGSVQSQGCVEG